MNLVLKISEYSSTVQKIGQVIFNKMGMNLLKDLIFRTEFRFIKILCLIYYKFITNLRSNF